MWLVSALVSSVLWAGIYVLDGHFVGRIFLRPWLGIVVSAGFALLALPAVLALAVVGGWVPVGPPTALLALASGAMFVGMQWTHFEAFRYTESGVVAAYWSLSPVPVVLASFLLLGEVLRPGQYLGIAILVAGALCLGCIDTSPRGKWKALGVTGVGCLFNTGFYLGQKEVFAHCPTLQGFALILCGMVAVGLLPLLRGGARRVCRANLPRLRRNARLIVAVELAHLGAIFTGQAAVDLGSASLVSAVEATTPAATFLISLLLYARYGRYGEASAAHALPAKLATVGGIGLGVWLLA